jgi:hypothetical protein
MSTGWAIALGVCSFLAGFGCAILYVQRVLRDYKRTRKLADDILRDMETRGY